MYLCKCSSFSLISRLYAISLLPHGAPLRSRSLFCIKFFFSPFSHMLYLDVFFLCVVNITKLECFHQAASHTISCCFSSSPIPLFFSELFLPPLRVVLTHFALLSYEQALRLPTSFPISGLARLGVQDSADLLGELLRQLTPLMLLFTFPWKALVACPPSSPWNLPSFTVASTFSSPCFCSDPLSCSPTLSPL